MSNKYIYNIILLSTLVLTFFGCKQDPKDDQNQTNQKDTTNQKVIKKFYKVPDFNGDSAYAFVKHQVQFGPRLVNTTAHAKTAVWLKGKFTAYGMKTIVQEFDATTYYGLNFKGKNIIASTNPEIKSRILLAAHWDTRHMADMDKNPNLKKKPILGADDGGSGVGVLLEIARILKDNPLPDLGIDIILFDAEDLGNDDNTSPESENSWCLGSQYWSSNPHIAGYKADFGILLDMVGAKNASFLKEGFSMNFAPNIVFKIWSTAFAQGYGGYFLNTEGGGITDDHVFVNRKLGIPMVDIINHNGQNFGSHWHTHGDNMSIIDKKTLHVVGQVVTTVIYNQASGTFL